MFDFALSTTRTWIPIKPLHRNDDNETSDTINKIYRWDLLVKQKTRYFKEISLIKTYYKYLVCVLLHLDIFFCFKEKKCLYIPLLNAVDPSFQYWLVLYEMHPTSLWAKSRNNCDIKKKTTEKCKKFKIKTIRHRNRFVSPFSWQAKRKSLNLYSPLRFFFRLLIYKQFLAATGANLIKIGMSTENLWHDKIGRMWRPDDLEMYGFVLNWH